MDPNEIRRYRPSRFSDIAGTANQARLLPIQLAVAHGQTPPAMLVVGPFGFAKTSFARVLGLSLNCQSRNTTNAEPCGSCGECRRSGPRYNYTGSPYRRIELDCTTLNRADVLALCEEYQDENDVYLFLDEIHHLHERNAQEPLLKFAEDFRGVLVAAVMEDRYSELIPPLRERFEEVRLVPPTIEEMVAFLGRKCADEWEIDAPNELLAAMVRASGRSFRICLRILADAAVVRPRRLTLTPIVSHLPGFIPDGVRLREAPPDGLAPLEGGSPLQAVENHWFSD